MFPLFRLTFRVMITGLSSRGKAKKKAEPWGSALPETMEYVDQAPQTLLPHTLFPMVNRRATMSAMFVKCNILGLLYALVNIPNGFF